MEDSKSSQTLAQESESSDARAEFEIAGQQKPSHIVGVGASAGGLEAIEQFFDHMAADSGLAFVVVQHLSPDFKSMMNELLARHTKMRIHRIEHEMEIEANTIYLIPPKKNLVVSNGKLILADHEPSQTLNLPIDIFFRSLAQDVGERAIGVVLSGTGSDGSRGVREIHEAGGLVVVQDEDSAKFDGMPRAAIATGLADFELPPHAMPEVLLNYLRHPLVALTEDSKVNPLTQEGGLSEIFALLRAKYGIDFTYYKTSTVQRRIERRITISRVADLSEYIHRLNTDESELNLLYSDLLIGVTEFFRDGPAFERMEKEVVPEIIANVSLDKTIRVWAPGCATGEEAYSLAILLHEEAERSGKTLDIKVFATDVHHGALNRAGAGIFNEASIANVTPARVGRYFTKTDGAYQITQTIRQMVIFANHNLVKDPPFTKIDLVTCRNVLIYLQPLAQRKILSMFHFALRTGAVLFLGPSESVNDLSDEFDAIDNRWRIFRKRRDVRLADTTRLPLTPALSVPALVPRQVVEPFATKQDTVLQRIYEAVMARHAPPGLLVNDKRELVHVFGDARRYLQVPEGQVTVDLMKMVEGDLRLAISSSTHRAMKENEPVVYNNVRMQGANGDENVKLTVEPLTDRRSNSKFLLICLEPIQDLSVPQTVETQFDARAESSERIVVLERELQYSKEHLQTTIEELETSNEELQSTNEELVAANEELQSTNEELHSVNEELYTVNSEHQRKIEELTQMTYDMNNLLRSTEIGTVFVDRDLHIRKFTPAIADEINLLPQDIGRPIEHISHNIDLGKQGLLDLTRDVLAGGEPIEREVHNRHGTPLLMRIFPYRIDSGEIAGVVLSLVNISVITEVQAKLRASEERLNLALRSAGVGTWDWSVGEDVVVWDDYLHPLFGLKSGEFGGTYQSFADIVHPDDRARVQSEVTASVVQDAAYDTVFRVVWPDDSVHSIHAKGKVYRDDEGQPVRMTGVCWDVTEQAHAEETQSRLAAIVQSSDDAIMGWSLDGHITSWNNAAERLYGFAPDEIIGRPASLLIPADRESEWPDILSKVSEGRSIQRYRTERRRKDGNTVEISTTISPIEDGQGHITGVSVISRDVTARVQMERDIINANMKLKQTNEELAQFAYVASHDLREPLRTIRSFCELLADNYKGQFDEQADRWIDFTIGGVHRMQALIDDLLTYSRVDSKAQPAESTDLNKVVDNVLANVNTSIVESGANVTHDELPTIHVESTQMTQLLQNLISNAIKYRGDEQPQIHISAEEKLGEWIFAVRDNGIGIKPEFHDKVFELFKRLHPRDEFSGTGIGLAICRKIVQRHNGRIWVESEPDSGSTFFFTITEQPNQLS